MKTKSFYIGLLLCISLILNSFSLFAQAPHWLWSKGFGGSSSETVVGLAKDGNNAIYMAGYFYSPNIKFGSTILTNSNLLSNSFIVKCDSTGNVIWAKGIDPAVVNTIGDIAVDSVGDIYVSGTFSGSSLTIGSTTLTTNCDRDIFLVKYDANGNVIWAKSAGGGKVGISVVAGNDAIDNEDNLYLEGYWFNDSSTTSWISFGPDSIAIAAGSGAYNPSGGNFLVKYDSNGNVVRAKTPPGIGKLATDKNGNIVVTGTYGSSFITFGSITLNNSGDLNTFITKYDSSGNVIWAKSIGGSYVEIDRGITINKNNNIYVTCNMESPSVTLGSFHLTNHSTDSSSDILVVKYDKNGSLIWAKNYGGTGSDIAYGISTDENNNLYLTGQFGFPSINFGATALNSVGVNGDCFVAKCDSNGNALWAKQTGGIDEVGANGSAGDGIVVDNSNVYVAGDFANPYITVGADTLQNYNPGLGYDDIFLARIGYWPLGIAKNHKNNKLWIFPNPSSGIFNIYCSKDLPTPQVYNMLGKKLKVEITKESEKQVQVNLSNYPKGIYFIKIGQNVKKVIVE